MARQEIDTYLAVLDEPARAALEQLRGTILEVVPDAEEGLSYGVPAFRVSGKPVAGFAAYKRHLTYVPHSGSVLTALADDLGDFEASKGALKFTTDTPLPTSLVTKLIRARLEELSG